MFLPVRKHVPDNVMRFPTCVSVSGRQGLTNLMKAENIAKIQSAGLQTTQATQASREQCHLDSKFCSLAMSLLDILRTLRLAGLACRRPQSGDWWIAVGLVDCAWACTWFFSLGGRERFADFMKLASEAVEGEGCPCTPCVLYYYMRGDTFKESTRGYFFPAVTLNNLAEHIHQVVGVVYNMLLLSDYWPAGIEAPPHQQDQHSF